MNNKHFTSPEVTFIREDYSNKRIKKIMVAEDIPVYNIVFTVSQTGKLKVGNCSNCQGCAFLSDGYLCRRPKSIRLVPYNGKFKCLSKNDSNGLNYVIVLEKVGDTTHFYKAHGIKGNPSKVNIVSSALKYFDRSLAQVDLKVIKLQYPNAYILEV